MKSEQTDPARQIVETDAPRPPSRGHVVRRAEEVVWHNVEDVLDEDTDLPLQPLDPDTEEARKRIREVERPQLAIDVEEEPGKLQFTLRHLLIGNTVLAVSFALMQWFAPSGLAGALGSVLLLGSILIAVYQVDQRVVLLSWWAMLLLYVMFCVFALFSVTP